MPLTVLNNHGESAKTESGVKTEPSVKGDQKIGRIEIDRELCIGAESCVVVAPDVYEMDDENIAVVKNPEGADFDTILQSAQACPVAAVILYDESGAQIYP